MPVILVIPARPVSHTRPARPGQGLQRLGGNLPGPGKMGEGGGPKRERAGQEVASHPGRGVAGLGWPSHKPTSQPTKQPNNQTTNRQADRQTECERGEDERRLIKTEHVSKGPMERLDRRME